MDGACVHACVRVVSRYAYRGKRTATKARRYSVTCARARQRAAMTDFRFRAILFLVASLNRREIARACEKRSRRETENTNGRREMA